MTEMYCEMILLQRIRAMLFEVIFASWYRGIGASLWIANTKPWTLVIGHQTLSSCYFCYNVHNMGSSRGRDAHDRHYICFQMGWIEENWPWQYHLPIRSHIWPSTISTLMSTCDFKVESCFFLFTLKWLDDLAKNIYSSLYIYFHL